MGSFSKCNLLYLLMYTSATIAGARRAYGRVYGNHTRPQERTNQRQGRTGAHSQPPPQRAEHRAVRAHSRLLPLPNTKEPLLRSEITGLHVVKASGVAYHERNFFCCKEEMLFGLYRCSWEPTSLRDLGHSAKTITPSVRLMAHRAALLDHLRPINLWLIISSVLKKTLHEGRKQSGVYVQNNSNKKNNEDTETIHMAFKIKSLALDLRLHLAPISNDAL